MNFRREDREQFAQLIGYSLSGFGDLHYTSDRVYGLTEKQGRALVEGSREK